MVLIYRSNHLFEDKYWWQNSHARLDFRPLNEKWREKLSLAANPFLQRGLQSTERSVSRDS